MQDSLIIRLLGNPVLMEFVLLKDYLRPLALGNEPWAKQLVSYLNNSFKERVQQSILCEGIKVFSTSF